MSRWRSGPTLLIVVALVVVAACSSSPSPAPTVAPTPVPTPVPTATASPSPRASIARPPATLAPSPTPEGTVYVVKKGDTLWAIANRHGVTLEALREANPEVTDPTKLRVGTSLTIPAP